MVKHHNVVRSKKFLSFVISAFLFLHLARPVSAQIASIIPADRMISWSPGIPGGVPNRSTVFANVRNAPYYAAGDGVTDDTAAIQSAIDNCPVGEVVYLPAGTYKTSGVLSIGKGIVLRGDGPDKTKIISSVGSTGAIFIGSWTNSSTGAGITSTCTKGSTSITLSSASGFNAGDYIIVYQQNDPSLVNMGDCTFFNRTNGGLLSQIVQIKGISGNTLTISPSLYYSYSASYSPAVLRMSDSPVEYAGVENLYVSRVNPQADDMIYMRNCAYCWVKNIESYMSFADHVDMEACFRCEIRDSYFHHATAYGSGGEGYGICLNNHTSDTLVENNIVYYLRHGVVLEGCGAGNVAGYNYSDRFYLAESMQWLSADFTTHCAHPYMNLFEGNIGNTICNDSDHGSSSHNTWFRNYVEGDSYRGTNESPVIYHRIPAEMDAYNRYINMVGNVLGRSDITYDYYTIVNQSTDATNDTAPYRLGYASGGSGSASGGDPYVASTLIRHGNFDYYNKATIWDPNISARTLPASLYLTQKPAFFGCRPWPAIGPDVSPMVGSLPAKDRFFGITYSCSSDTTPPSTYGYNPAQGTTGVPTNTSIVVHVTDSGSGVNQSSIAIKVNGNTVTPVITGTSADYTVTYTPSTPFVYSQVVAVTISASDSAGNVMSPVTYSFTTVSAPTPSSLTNLALGLLPTVDSTYSGYNPAVLTDGDTTATGGTTDTWASSVNVTSPHWVAIDFGKSCNIRQVNLYWGWNAYRSKYMTPQEVHVQVWNGTSFSDVSVLKNPTVSALTSTTISTITTSKIRIYQPANMGNTASSGTMALMWMGEIQVYGTALTNVASGILPTVDSTYSGYSPAVLTDGDTTATGGTTDTWASVVSPTSPHWVAIDFGKSCNVRQVNLYWGWNAYRSQYMTPQEVHVQAWNGTSFYDVSVLKNPTVGALTTISIPATTTSKIRIYQPANMGYTACPGIMWIGEIQAWQ